VLIVVGVTVMGEEVYVVVELVVVSWAVKLVLPAETKDKPPASAIILIETIVV